MDKKIFNKKRFFFLSITFFFFIIMLFLYLNVSNIMYNNASILLSLKEGKNLSATLGRQFTFTNSGITETVKINLDSFLNSLEYYPPVLYLKIYSPDGKLLYQKGRDILTTSSLQLPTIHQTGISYKKARLKDTKTAVYELIIPYTDENSNVKWFLNMLFDIQTVDNGYFNEKRVIFLIVFIVNLFIIAFLMMMVLNLQKRLFIAENTLSSLTVSDKLTGLLTKDAFFTEMRMEIDRLYSNGGNFTLITADIDGFVDINDTCGYEFGDHILKNIAQVFKETYRRFDTIGRFGGDEIVVIMAGADEEESYKLTELCRKAITETNFFFEGNQIPVTMSFGIADTNSCRGEGKDGETLKRNMFRDIMFNSLNSLSRAKRSGKNKAIKYSSLNAANQLNI